MDQGILTIDIKDELYPQLLKQIHQPPDKLYLRGDPDILSHQPMLAVVGSRKASVYGKQAADAVLTPIVKASIPIVSGLAYGIDSIAHEICLANNTPTIAVLGSGINDSAIYPSRHVQLAHRIIDQGGAVISEHPADTPPHPGHFPTRNRIIAGLTAATLIVQAATKSGSLITARLALESDRDVAAIPGSITDPLAAGTNQLIQQGATPILEPQDLLDLLNINTTTSPSSSQLDLSPTQEQVFTSLSITPQHIDQIASITTLSSPTISITLTELELLGAAEHVGGMKYIKKT